MNADELEERIDEFLEWNYRFEFDNGVTTPLLDPTMINRQEQRRRYMFDPLLGVMGGSLAGARVLDLGCGAGFWALEAARAGAEFVHGIDAKANSIEQAKLVFEAAAIDPAGYCFEQRNIFGQPLRERFDVVLCIALMQQLAKPVELFELIGATGAGVVLIETDISPAGSSSFEVSALTGPRRALEHRMVLVPTRRAVIDLAEEFGYETIALARDMSDYTGLEDYRRGKRLAFLCSKEKPLGGLPKDRTSVASRVSSTLARGLRRPRG